MQKLQQLCGDKIPALVMFDLDGTLVDSVPDIASAINRLLADLSLSTVDESVVRSWVGNGAEKLVERALRHRAYVSDCANDDNGLSESLARFKTHYAQCCAVNTVLYDGVLECLQALHKQQVPMAIVTNKPREFVPPILSLLGIEHFFSAVLGGDDLPQRKPAPEPLLSCASQLDCAIKASLMVGDSYNDVEAARRAGIPIVAVNYGYNHGRPIVDEQPDMIVSSLAELIE
jgi:phosphoglycolate phosphatase